MDSLKEQYQSPCVRQCCLDDKDICLGCFRSLKEILFWSEADAIQKLSIIENCKNRKAAINYKQI